MNAQGILDEIGAETEMFTVENGSAASHKES